MWPPKKAPYINSNSKAGKSTFSDSRSITFEHGATDAFLSEQTKIVERTFFEFVTVHSKPSNTNG